PASALMKKLTVEPVPTPTIMSSSTYFSAASAAAFFWAFASMGRGYRMLQGSYEERRLPRPHPRREGLRRRGGKPARRTAGHLASHREPRAAQARGQAARVLLQAARRVQQDGEPQARAAGARRHLRERRQPRPGRGARRAAPGRARDGRDARHH